MSKSRLNVVNPDDMVSSYGADSMRLYEMFMGPLDRDKPWSEEGVRGCYNFLKRAWNLFIGHEDELLPFIEGDPSPEARRLLHQTIKAVTENLEEMKFNTAIARLMEFVNEGTKAGGLHRDRAEAFLLLLAPFAPHLAEELWQRIGHDKSLAYETWPSFDESFCQEDSLKVAVQVNGKVRATLIVSAAAADEDVLNLALENEKVLPWLEGKQIRFKKRVAPGVVSLAVK